MKTNYETVIGIEVHVELNTETKMFCRCSAQYFGKAPNTSTCPVCLGLPGATPYINEEVIKKCIQIGLALNCSINDESRYFERKNYFYPDLPKGYQISQLVKPLCINGWLMVTGDDGKEIKIRINRAHQEEDTAKLVHQFGMSNVKSQISNEKDGTGIDFNRSGVPLTEIVTEPDFRDSSQVKDYAKKLQQIFRYIGVSNADMEKGDMRLEANVSVRPITPGSQASPGVRELPNYRVELKNINSFRFMTAAIEYEVKRQIEALEKGEKLTQETRGWNQDKKETYLQRSKEDAHDYRYFPEPDLPEVISGREQVKSIKDNLPELPAEKLVRFQSDYGLSKQQATTLIDTRELSEYYEELVQRGKGEGVSPVQIANHIINKKVSATSVSVDELISEITSKSSGIISDQRELEKICEEAIIENEKAVVDFKSGKENALQVIIGTVMRKSSGKAEASKVKEILERLLK